MGDETVLFDVQEGVGRITLNRPASANAMSLELGRDLMAAVLRCEAREDVRAVLLSGAGRHFCAGGDLRAFAAQGETLSAHFVEATTYLHVAVTRLSRFRAPVVAAVQGSTVGAGLSLACISDLVIAGASTTFTFGYNLVGLTPDGGMTFTLQRLIGLRRAMEIALTQRRVGADEALAWGLVTRVVPDDRILSCAEELAAELAAGPTSSLGATKRLLLDGSASTLERQMAAETDALVQAAATADGREGPRAFAEGRRPVYTGR